MHPERGRRSTSTLFTEGFTVSQSVDDTEDLRLCFDPDKLNGGYNLRMRTGCQAGETNVASAKLYGLSLVEALDLRGFVNPAAASAESMPSKP